MTTGRASAGRLAPLGCVLVAALLACGGASAPRTVVLVSVDTLRADAVMGFGARAGASPNLRAFLSEAVRFERAYAPEPHTLPSHTTLLTSLHPVSHGVAGVLQGGIALADGIPTLAEILRAKGFATAAFVNGGFLHPRFGLGRGFELYDYFSDIGAHGPESGLGRTAAETNVRVLDWLDGQGDDVFLFVHYFDVHSDPGALPYDSPPSYRSRPTGEFDWGDRGGSRFLASFDGSREPLDDERLAALRALYAAGVRYADDCLGALFDGLRERGRYDDALIVLVADHGEEFQEHGRFLHTQLYEESLRVPLALRLPGGENGGASVPKPVALADVLPTVLDQLGIAPPAGAQGRSLLGAARGEEDAADRTLFFVSRASGTLGLRDGHWKLIYHPRSRAVELYDLRADPREREDRSQTQADTTQRLLRRLLAWRRSAPRLYRGKPTSRVRLDLETSQQLQALGYLQRAPERSGPARGGPPLEAR
jgi:arylsulfatase A-like enzyme